MPGIVHAPDEIYRPIRAPAEGPAPGYIEGISAAFRLSEDTQFTTEQGPRNAQAYGDLLNTLEEMGVDTSSSGPLYKSVQNSIGKEMRVYDREAILAEVARQQKRNPGMFKGVATRREDFDQYVANRGGARQKDQAIAARAGLLPNLIGGMGSAMTDPVNQISMFASGGQAGFWRTVAQETAIGALGEIALLPDTKKAYDLMGEDFTLKDAAIQVGTGALASGALASGGKLAGDYLLPQVGKGWNAVKAMPKAAQEALWAKAINAVPALQKKMAGKVDWDALDDHLPELVEGLVGKDNLSLQEKFAVSALRRDAEIEALNPYRRDGAGISAHRKAFEAHMQRVADDIARMRTPRALTMAASDGPASIGGGAPMMGGIVTIPGKRGQIGYANDIYQGLKRRGAPDHVARGIAAGIHAESASDHTIFGGYKGRALGLGQWLGERRAEIIRRYGMKPTREQQLDFLWEELQGRDPGGRKVLAQADEASVLRSYIVDFMRPAPGAQTVGDLKRGMAALGRGGETMNLPADAPGGMAPDAPEIDPEAAVTADLAARRAALDTERAQVAEMEIAAMPELRRDLFPDETSWRIAQAERDAEMLGMPEPAVTRQSVWEDARAVLTTAKAGEVPGALYHPDVGPIDVKWGNAKGGLQHISEQHPEVLDDLPAILDAMEVQSQSANRIVMQSDDHKAVVRLDWDSKAQQWLLTAYERKGKTPVGRSTDVPDIGAQDGSPTRGAGDAVAANAAKSNAPRGTASAMLDAYWQRSRDPKPVYGHFDDAGQLQGWSRSAKEMEGRAARDGGKVERIEPPHAEPLTVADVNSSVYTDFDDPVGPAAMVQADSLAHDMKVRLDSGKAGEVRMDAEGASETGEALMERLAAEDAAIAAIKGCL